MGFADSPTHQLPTQTYTHACSLTLNSSPPVPPACRTRASCWRMCLPIRAALASAPTAATATSSPASPRARRRCRKPAAGCTQPPSAPRGERARAHAGLARPVMRAQHPAPPAPGPKKGPAGSGSCIAHRGAPPRGPGGGRPGISFVRNCAAVISAFPHSALRTLSEPPGRRRASFSPPGRLPRPPGAGSTAYASDSEIPIFPFVAAPEHSQHTCMSFVGRPKPARPPPRSLGRAGGGGSRLRSWIATHSCSAVMVCTVG